MRTSALLKKADSVGVRGVIRCDRGVVNPAVIHAHLVRLIRLFRIERQKKRGVGQISMRWGCGSRGPRLRKSAILFHLNRFCAAHFIPENQPVGRTFSENSGTQSTTKDPLEAFLGAKPSIGATQ